MGKVHEKKTYTVTGKKVFNFAILRVKKKKEKIGEKRSMGFDIIDAIQILGIQNKDVNSLNPLVVSITSDTVMQELTKYKKHKY